MGAAFSLSGVPTAAPSREEILGRLRDDWAFWAPNVAKIINTAQEVIPFVPKPAQLRIWEAMVAQQAAGRPIRIIVPKARKEGVSTMAVSMLVQRATQRPNHNAISVAQDKETAGELLQMATVMHSLLPDTKEWPIKPQIVNKARRKELGFGNPSRVAQASGDLGLNSRLVADTANEFEAGRGFTYHSVHCSEPAFWADAKRKLTSLLNAVPDDPGTLVILESTSNGHNHWRQLCMDALDGNNDFTLVFLAWFEEPQYVRPFLSDEERGEFIESIGTGPYGDEEPDLVEQYGCTPEQLHWRRWAIANRAQGDLRIFHQEYPSTLEQSFLSTGRHVFNQEFVAKARRVAEESPKPEKGGLEATAHKTIRHRYGAVDVPVGPKWVPKQGDWLVWKMPVEGAQYVIAVDPAGDEVMDADERAMHAVQVIDHRTREQVAELEMQGDADQVAVQIYLAALFFNRAWIAIETTGGWGLSMVRRIFHDFRHPFVYKRRKADSPSDSQEDRLGWDTNRTSKVILEDGAREMLREGTHGIRSTRLVRQFTTYVKDGSRGKTGPAPGERSDLLMAWMIAQQVAQELTIKTSSGVAGGAVSTTTNDYARFMTR